MNDAMNTMNRRFFFKASTLAGLSLARRFSVAAEAPGPRRKFTIALACGMIGVRGDPRKEIEWAVQFGFEAVEPAAAFLGKFSEGELEAYLGEMKSKKLSWGAAGFPVQFRGDDATFEQSMEVLPGFARTLQRAGVTRVATWLSPGHRTLTYLANFRQHAKRLREAARVLGDHGLRLGLEYVGPKSSWSVQRFPFIHTMAEMKDLIAEIGRDNVGFLLDTWHWYTAKETEADLLTLKGRDVILCHVNDAPQGVAVDQQIDSRRELPCATGAIDLKAFMGAMLRIGYDGPMACEPFNQELRKLPAEQALATVAAAMKKAVGLVDVPGQ
jgi:sugar phosphate isomerase/epimerase